MTPQEKLKEIEKRFNNAGEQDLTIYQIEWLIARVKRLEEALKFYGYIAIHNPNCGDKALQYWNDAGIYDHGEIARKALTCEDQANNMFTLY